MTRSYSPAAPTGPARQREVPDHPPISLRQRVPTGWHQDRPAFAGDPDMDWESAPEPPRDIQWPYLEKAPREFSS